MARKVYKVECWKHLRKLIDAYGKANSSTREEVRERLQIATNLMTVWQHRVTAIAELCQLLLPESAADSSEDFTPAETRGKTSETFIKNVRAFMKARDISQADLAKTLQCSQPAVANVLVRKRHPQRRTIHRFAKALGVSELDLLS